jgi:hypothetical protein
MHDLFGEEGKHAEGNFPKLVILGRTKHVTKCQNCGREGLKNTVVCAKLGDDGHPTKEYFYFGTDCASKIAGRKQEDVDAEADEQEAKGRPRVPKPKAVKPNEGQQELALRFQAAITAAFVERFSAEQASNEQPAAPKYDFSRAILNGMSRKLKSQGFDVRGSDDVKQLLGRGHVFKDGEFTHDAWKNAYHAAAGSVDKRKQTKQNQADVRKLMPNVNWEVVNSLKPTHNHRVAGYIHPKGHLLDLSGGDPTGRTRGEDHRIVGGYEAIEELGAHHGWIRYMPEAGALELRKQPTPAQVRQIQRLINIHNGEIYLDLHDGIGERNSPEDYERSDQFYRQPRRKWSGEFRPGAKASRILNAIKQFYAGQEPPRTIRDQFSRKALVERYASSEQDGDRFFEESVLRQAKNQPAKSRERVVYMHPNEFLKMAEGLHNGPSQDKISGIHQAVSSGVRLDAIPELKFDHDGNGTATVIGHDGRHRAIYLRDNHGVTQIPVRLVSVGGPGGAIRWGSQEPGSFDRIKGQWPQVLKGETNGRVRFPVGDLRSQSSQAGLDAHEQQPNDLFGNPVKPAPAAPAKFDSNKGKQQSLFAGLNAKEGQMNLFADDGVPDDLVAKSQEPDGPPQQRSLFSAVADALVERYATRKLPDAYKPSWYLKSAQLLAQRMPEQAPASQVLALLRNNQISPDELDWTGLQSHLESLGNSPVRRDDMLKLAKGMRVKEKWLHGQQTKYPDQVLPAGQQYKELLLTLPKDKQPMPFKHQHWGSTPNVLAHARMHGMIGADGKQHLHIEEIQSDWHQKGRHETYIGRNMFQPVTELPPHYKVSQELTLSSHALAWDARKAEYNRVVGAHPDFGDESKVLKLPNGQELLDLDHLVSSAFFQNQVPNKRTFDDWLSLVRNYVPDAFTNVSLEPQPRWVVQDTSIPGKHTIEGSTREKAIAEALRIHNARALDQVKAKGVPDAPFKNNWRSLMMKRILDFAAKNGYHRVTWTPGEEQAARWNEGFHANNFHYEPNGGHFYIEDSRVAGGGLKVAQGFVRRDGTLQIDSEYSRFANMHHLHGRHVDNLFGQGFHGQIQDAINGHAFRGKHENGNHHIPLKINQPFFIGGEKKKKLYDEMLPSDTAKVIKPHGGVLNHFELNVPEYSGEKPSYTRKLKVQGFDITPQMRESVIGKGQSLFSARGDDDVFVERHQSPARNEQGFASFRLGAGMKPAGSSESAENGAEKSRKIADVIRTALSKVVRKPKSEEEKKESFGIGRRVADVLTERYSTPYTLRSAKLIREKIPDNVPANQALATLRNNQISPDEMQWTGLEEYLTTLGDSRISKKHILKMLDSVRLGETIRSENASSSENWDHVGGGPKYAAYSTPFGYQKNYREMLLQWRNPRTQLTSPYSEPGYKSSHFPEHNVLAHVRLTDRMTAHHDSRELHRKIIAGQNLTPEESESYRAHTGFGAREPNAAVRPKATLHIEELQSDWHNEGRKHGYKSKAEERNLYDLDQLVRDAFAKRSMVDDSPIDPELTWKLYKSSTANYDGAPEGPMAKTYHNAVIRRMIHYAVNNGYDRVTWAPGWEHGRRYPGGMHHVKHIDYAPAEAILEGSKLYAMPGWNIWAYDHSGRMIPQDDLDRLVNRNYRLKGGFTHHEIRSLFGDEVAGSIIGGKGRNLPGQAYKRVRPTQPLAIGHEAGLRKLYDHEMPKHVTKIIKPFNGQLQQFHMSHRDGYPGRFEHRKGVGGYDIIDKATGKIALDGMGSPHTGLPLKLSKQLAWSYDRDSQSAPVMGFDITPEMREHFKKEGPQLFSVEVSNDWSGERYSAAWNEPHEHFPDWPDASSFQEQPVSKRPSISDRIAKQLLGKRSQGVSVRAAVLPEPLKRNYLSFVGKSLGAQHKHVENLGKLVQRYRDPRYETLRAVFLKGNKVVGANAVTSRHPSAVAYQPNIHIRGIYEDAHSLGADSVWMVHNHPTGNASPSPQDHAATAKMQQMFQQYNQQVAAHGYTLQPKIAGHLIVNHDHFTTHQPGDPHGTHQRHELKKPGKPLFRTVKTDGNDPKQNQLGLPINGPGQVANLGWNIHKNPKAAVVALADVRANLRALLDVDASHFTSDDPSHGIKLMGALRRMHRKLGTAAAFLYLPKGMKLNHINPAVREHGAFLDVIHHNDHSTVGMRIGQNSHDMMDVFEKAKHPMLAGKRSRDFSRDRGPEKPVASQFAAHWEASIERFAAKRRANDLWKFRSVEELQSLPEYLPASQALATLVNRNVSPDELKWTGLERALAKAGNNPVSRDELIKLASAFSMTEKIAPAGQLSSIDYSDYNYKNGQNPFELLVGLPAGYRTAVGVKTPTKVSHRHWQHDNVLAHMRGQDMASVDGKKHLHLEELQSDWHQAGRDHGYSEEKVPSAKQIAEFFNQNRAKFDNDYAFPYPGFASEHTWETLSPAYRRDVRNSVVSAMSGDRMPAAPFSKHWHMMLMKRAIKLAADQGHDRISWPVGSEHAKRYSLTQKIHSLGYDPEGQVLHLRQITPAGNASPWSSVGETVPPDRLHKYVGRGVAANLLAAPKLITGPGGNAVHHLSGKDLEIGGDGMKWYDVALVNDTNKLLKKMGGGRVYQTHVDAGSDGHKPVHTFDITPEMKSHVSGQVSLFSLVSDDDLELERYEGGEGPERYFLSTITGAMDRTEQGLKNLWNKANDRLGDTKTWNRVQDFGDKQAGRIGGFAERIDKAGQHLHSKLDEWVSRPGTLRGKATEAIDNTVGKLMGQKPAKTPYEPISGVQPGTHIWLNGPHTLKQSGGILPHMTRGKLVREESSTHARVDVNGVHVVLPKQNLYYAFDPNRAKSTPDASQQQAQQAEPAAGQASATIPGRPEPSKAKFTNPEQRHPHEILPGDLIHQKNPKTGEWVHYQVDRVNKPKNTEPGREHEINAFDVTQVEYDPESPNNVRRTETRASIRASKRNELGHKEFLKFASSTLKPSAMKMQKDQPAPEKKPEPAQPEAEPKASESWTPASFAAALAANKVPPTPENQQYRLNNGPAIEEELRKIPKPAQPGQKPARTWTPSSFAEAMVAGKIDTRTLSGKALKFYQDNFDVIQREVTYGILDSVKQKYQPTPEQLNAQMQAHRNKDEAWPAIHELPRNQFVNAGNVGHGGVFALDKKTGKGVLLYNGQKHELTDQEFKDGQVVAKPSKIRARIHQQEAEKQFLAAGQEGLPEHARDTYEQQIQGAWASRRKAAQGQVGSSQGQAEAAPPVMTSYERRGPASIGIQPEPTPSPEAPEPQDNAFDPNDPANDPFSPGYVPPAESQQSLQGPARSIQVDAGVRNALNEAAMNTRGNRHAMEHAIHDFFPGGSPQLIQLLKNHITQHFAEDFETLRQLQDRQKAILRSLPKGNTAEGRKLLSMVRAGTDLASLQKYLPGYDTLADELQQKFPTYFGGDDRDEKVKDFIFNKGLKRKSSDRMVEEFWSAMPPDYTEAIQHMFENPGDFQVIDLPDVSGEKNREEDRSWQETVPFSVTADNALVERFSSAWHSGAPCRGKSKTNRSPSTFERGRIEAAIRKALVVV